MKMFQKPMWMAMMFAMVALFACVTINIYFPAEKVESVAGDIVNDIRGKKPEQKGNQSKSLSHANGSLPGHTGMPGIDTDQAEQYNAKGSHATG